MASPARNFATGRHYHVFNRGNHREAIFGDDLDRRYFLRKLDEYAVRDDITIIAYCLMPNHYHLLLRQDGDIPVGHMVQSWTAGFTRMYNNKYRTVGRLFQQRFQAKAVLDEQYLLHLSVYIHLNPQLFANYRTYAWSSYAQYIGRSVGLCDPSDVVSVQRRYQNISYDTFVAEYASSGEAATASQNNRRP